MSEQQNTTQDIKLEKDYFDVIIIGTGLTQSILSAAISKIGKSVLHIDKNDFYGGCNNTLKLKELKSWLNVEEKYFNKKKNKTEDFCSDKLKDIQEISSEFHLDITNSLIYADSSLVKSIKDFAVNYVKFFPINNFFILLKNGLSSVPLDKADILKLEYSLDDKRKLTNFFVKNFSGDFNSSIERLKYMNSSFSSFVEEFDLSNDLKKLIYYGVAFLDSEKHSIEDAGALSCENKFFDVFSRVKSFIESKGIYCKGPMFYPLFGICELPQAFCRASAVNGSTFVLNLKPEKCLFDKENKSVSIETPYGQTIRSSKIVSCCDDVSVKDVICKQCREINVSRAICIIDKSLCSDVRNLFLVIPPAESVSHSLSNRLKNQFSIRITQLSSNFKVCPDEYFVVYMSTPFHSNSEIDIENTVKELFHTKFDIDETIKEKPNLLFLATYTQTSSLVNRDTILKPENLFVVDESVSDVSLSYYQKQAEELFKEMFPGEEFFITEKTAKPIVLESYCAKNEKELECMLDDFVFVDDDMDFFK